MEKPTNRARPTAAFMAFGTKGDVHPIAAIAAAFAVDQEQYRVVLITHSAHKNLAADLLDTNVDYFPVSSPPVISPYEDHGFAGSPKLCISHKKMLFYSEHRQECLYAVENIFGNGPSVDGDFLVINFFALEGWSLAELLHIRCVVAAPYVVPYSAPASFERQFRKEFPFLYRYLQEAPDNKICWKDVMHWMWPLFTEDWGLWRRENLNLSPCPFTDPVTGLPICHDRYHSPLLLYGFDKLIVECPDYWPPNVHISGFWFLPLQWQFSCKNCRAISDSLSSGQHNVTYEMCLAHAKLQSFLATTLPSRPIFIGLNSIGSMGFLRNPLAFIHVLQNVLETTSYRFILLSAGYEPLDAAARVVAAEESSNLDQNSEDEIYLSGGRLICFSGTMPYSWLFSKCAVAVHHGGSGSTAAALHAGIPQVICPFMGDQFYWAERMFWLGVAPQVLRRRDLIPDENDETSIRESASILSKAIHCALSPQLKRCASVIADLISQEDGVSKAVKILKEEVCCPVPDL